MLALLSVNMTCDDHSIWKDLRKESMHVAGN